MFITECLAGGTGTEAANRLRVAEVWLLQPSPRLDRTQQPICSSRLPCTHLFYMRQGMSKVGNQWSTRLLASLSYLVSPQQMWDQSLFLCNYDRGSGHREGRLDARDISETELAKFGDQLDVKEAWHR